MSSPPTSSFRAEPFRNLTPKSLAPSVSSFTVATSDTRRRAVPLVVDDIGVHHRHNQDELVDEDGDVENYNLPSESVRGGYRGEPPEIHGRLGVNSRPSTFLPASITPEMSNMPSNLSGDGSLVSNHQRSSISSSTSSGSLPRRSSSGDGVSEMQTSAAGRGKRKSISAVQSGMMNSFKIRPPTVWEATGGSQLAPAPKGTYFSPPPGSHYPGTNVHMVAGAAVPEDRLRDAIVQQEMTPSAEILPRADRVVKPVRKRARREEPSDPDYQVVFHDDTAPMPASTITRASSSDLVQPQIQSPLAPPLPQPPVISPLPPIPSVITTIPTETISPPIAVTAPPISSPPAIIAPDPLPVDYQATLSSSAQPLTTQTKPDARSTLFDASDRTFTIPSPDPLDRNGPPPKRWTPVFREIVTMGGGSWKAATWISQGDASAPTKAPADFKPVPRSRPYGTDIPIPASSGIALGGSSSVGTTGPTLGASVGLAQKALVSKAALDGSRTLAPSRKIKKAKSEGHMKASGATTSLAAPSGPAEGIASGASSPVLGSVPLTPIRSPGKKGTAARKTKKSTAERGNAGVEGAGTPAVVDPPPLAPGHADTDTEMKDA
ncbi:hypothetical protein FRC19_008532 [Serendipita sp. 401]|nr:hypothetical protein FRC19_008532 [Serendipita sp. 401]